MARPKTARNPETLDDTQAAIDHDALDQAHAALTEHSQHLAQIDAQYGLAPYNYDGSVSRLQHLRAEIGTRLLEMGLVLIQMREREPQGQFYAALERAEINDRFARRAMQVARKFGADPLRRALADQIGISKVLALVAEDDADIDELASGGELAGHTANEFATMTKADVVAALKAEREEHKQDKDATGDLLRAKDERINTLLKNRRRIERSGARVQADELLADMDAAAVEAASAIKRLRDTVSAIRSTYAEAGETVDEDVGARIDQNVDLAKGWADALVEELEEA